MANIDFSQIFDQLKTNVFALAQNTVNDYVDQARTDGLNLLNESQEKLEKWTLQLANQEIDTGDFEWLVLSQKDVVAMDALKQAGLAEIKIQQFRDGVLKIIVDTVSGLIKI